MTVLGIILVTLVFSALLAFVLGAGLGVAREKFRIERNPLIDRVRAALPSVNCGACGYAGCDAYAEAVAERGEDINLCTSGGKASAEALGAIMRKDVQAEDQVSVLR